MTVAPWDFAADVMTWFETAFGPLGVYSVKVLKIIGIDLVLAGDNAVVIALACRTLPLHQRMLGILLGAAAAVVLRVLFTLVVQQVLDVSLLKLAGGIVLLWIAVKLLISEEGGGPEGRSGSNLWEAVRIVAVADMVMSLDNVIAIAAAAQGDPALIVFGLLVSIPLVVGGATLITNLLTQYPILVWAGAALLGWVAGELVASEPALGAAIGDVAETFALSPGAVTYMIAAAGAAFVCVAGYMIERASERGETT